jgi:flagellar biosynthetic protein FlhB
MASAGIAKGECTGAPSFIILVIYIAMRDKLPVAVRAMQLSMEDGALRFWNLLWDLSMRLAVMLLVMALVDYLQKQRELAKKRMMSSVPKADVIITNPTTLAIALLYDRKVMAAPQITAKGKGFVARKIRELAETHGVPVIENKPLAWALYESAEVGEEVPENLYRGVAEILAMVYRLQKK